MKARSRGSIELADGTRRIFHAWTPVWLTRLLFRWSIFIPAGVYEDTGEMCEIPREEIKSVIVVHQSLRRR